MKKFKTRVTIIYILYFISIVFAAVDLFVDASMYYFITIPFTLATGFFTSYVLVKQKKHVVKDGNMTVVIDKSDSKMVNAYIIHKNDVMCGVVGYEDDSDAVIGFNVNAKYVAAVDPNTGKISRIRGYETIFSDGGQS